MEIERSSGIIVYTYKDKKRLFLVLKRGKSLDMPKGHIEKGEDEHATAIRETYEETGIKVEPERFFKYVMKYSFRRDGKLFKKKLVMFLGEVHYGTNVSISKEHTGFAWMDIDEASKRFRFKNQINALRSANSYVEKLEKMRIVNHDYARLADRKGFELSKKFVPGDGPLSARVMIIGQAPGAKEDDLLRPFVGRAGRLLNQLIDISGMSREDIFITSTVQFFPYGNRMPKKEEVEICKPFLASEINIIKPKLIICLGSLSMETLTGKKKISKFRGKILYADMGGLIHKVKCFPTLHPAAGLRFQKNIPLLEADFKKLKRIISH